ncbi:MAG: RNA 2',3'-cyclic phosphodiesterase [Candidatus Dormibacteraeota bacterium]|nr:RNA 2',3'-cyclic phosphodiesterase [Candidatus Dormibacteraeota bacterium]
MGTSQLEEAPQALKVRAFFGLPLPEKQRRQLDRYLAACAASAPEFRWTPAANLHLTVRFIGNIERSIVEGIADKLAENPLTGFELELGDVGTFKRGRLVRVVWLQVRSGADAAGELAARVELECSKAGLAPEARPFQPHLTLARARARDGAVLRALPPPPKLPSWSADELILYRSHLRPAGSVYEPLRRLRLS